MMMLRSFATLAAAVGFLPIAMIVDLWAKAYDAPVAQLVAKAALMALAAGTLGSTVKAGAFLADSAGGIVSIWIALVAVGLVLALVLWTIDLLDWRSTYVGALLGVIHAVMGSAGGPSTGVLAAGVPPAVALIVMSVLREWPSRKLTQSVGNGGVVAQHRAELTTPATRTPQLPRSSRRDSS